MKAVLLDTDNKNVKIEIRHKDGAVRVTRKTKVSTGEVLNPQDDSETIETITVTRKFLSQI